MKSFAIQLQADRSLHGVLTPVFNVARDSNGLIIRGLNVGDTQPQNEAIILMSNVGEMKCAPTLGVGLDSATLLEVNNTTGFKHEIRRNYALEGLQIERLDCPSIDKLNIIAKY